MAKRNVPKGMMLMVHKDFQDREPALVLIKMFENVWKEKGWEKFTEPDLSKVTVPPSSPEGQDKPSSKPGN
ncbi:hypothetical protein LCGC14_1074240 [marine sediment metagenome]|uniref:Uncharacterized protein n=1 Tax=marine sediment metagenome TaxID=412755 RepID=A0A0F9MH53_9ZZZZ